MNQFLVIEYIDGAYKSIFTSTNYNTIISEAKKVLSENPKKILSIYKLATSFKVTVTVENDD